MTEARADVLALFAEMDIEPVIVDETATKLGGVETRAHAKVCARALQAAPRAHRGRRRHPPQLRGREGRRGHHAPVRPGRAHPRAGLPGRRHQLHAGAPPRLLLRQDLRLQRPAPVRLRLHADRAPHHPRAVGRVPQGPRQLRARLQGRQRHEDGPPGGHRHAAGRLQDGALQREAPGSLRHRRQRHRPLGGLRPGRQADRRPRQGDGQAGRDPRAHRAPHGTAGPAS